MNKLEDETLTCNKIFNNEKCKEIISTEITFFEEECCISLDNIHDIVINDSKITEFINQTLISRGFKEADNIYLMSNFIRLSLYSKIVLLGNPYSKDPNVDDIIFNTISQCILADKDFKNLITELKSEINRVYTKISKPKDNSIEIIDRTLRSIILFTIPNIRLYEKEFNPIKYVYSWVPNRIGSALIESLNEDPKFNRIK